MPLIYIGGRLLLRPCFQNGQVKYFPFKRISLGCLHWNWFKTMRNCNKIQFSPEIFLLEGKKRFFQSSHFESAKLEFRPSTKTGFSQVWLNYRHNYNDGKVDTFQISNPNALIDLYLSQILFLKHFPETPFCTLDGQGSVFKSAILSANHSASQRSPTKLWYITHSCNWLLKRIFRKSKDNGGVMYLNVTSKLPFTTRNFVLDLY